MSKCPVPPDVIPNRFVYSYLQMLLKFFPVIPPDNGRVNDLRTTIFSLLFLEENDARGDFVFRTIIKHETYRPKRGKGRLIKSARKKNDYF